MKRTHWMPALAAAAAFAWGEAVLCWLWPAEGLQPTALDLLLSWVGWTVLCLPALHPKGERVAAGLVLALALPPLLGSAWWGLLGILLAAAAPKLGLGVFALSGLAWAALLPRSQPPEPGEGPDMLLVTVDTLRADHGDQLGLGPPVVAVSAAPWTLPAMDSLMLGQPVSEHGGGLLTSSGLSRPDGVSLAARLRESGPSTQAFVCNPHLRQDLGFDRGFQRFVHSDSWRDPSLLRHLVDERIHRWGGPVPRLWKQRDQLLIEHARDALAGPPGGRFVWLHVLGPHEYHRDPAPGFDGAEPSERPQAYSASVLRTGERLSLLFAELPPETRVLVLSDHGESLGERELWGHGSALDAPQLLVPAWAQPTPLQSPPGLMAAWELPGHVFLSEPLVGHPSVPVAGVRKDPAASGRWSERGLLPDQPATPATQRHSGSREWDRALEALGYQEPAQDKEQVLELDAP